MIARALRAAAMLVAALALAGPVAAQDGPSATPRLTLDFPETEAIPGQGLSLRLTVLVPTHMPKPPVWPSFEAPNLWVRVASTGPTSESIGGETWAGVTRRYLLAPMVPGEIALPAAEVGVTYVDPQTNEPRSVSLAVEPVRIAGTIPQGAEGLDPFLAAQSLSLKQTVEGEPGAMEPGASITRTVVATIGGTSPMFLPPLLEPVAIDGLRAYPGEPALAEKTDRGVLSGTRTERVTYVAEGGGTGTVPPASLDWYNLRTSKVETATVKGFDVVMSGPKAGGDGGAAERDWRAIALWSLAAVAALGLLALAVRVAWAPLRRVAAARREAWLASEGHAFAALSRAVRERDHAALWTALDDWAAAAAAARPGAPDPRRDPRLARILADLGRARYREPAGDEAAAWSALSAVLVPLRRATRAHAAAAPALPPLNPVPPTLAPDPARA